MPVPILASTLDSKVVWLAPCWQRPSPAVLVAVLVTSHIAAGRDAGSHLPVSALDDSGKDCVKNALWNAFTRQHPVAGTKRHGKQYIT